MTPQDPFDPRGEPKQLERRRRPRREAETIDERELGGRDPLDAQVPGPPPVTGALARFRVRAALGLRPAVAPSLLFIPLGLLLGPVALNVATRETLLHLDPVVAAALAVLGVFVGLAFGRRPPAPRVLSAAAVEATLTVVIVSGTVWYLMSTWQVSLGAPAPVLALAMGVVASVSSAPLVGRSAAASLASAIADVDDVLPIALGAAALVFVHPHGPVEAALLGGWSILFALAIAFAANLLFATSGPAERVGFLVGAVALIAGCAAYVGASGLLAGFAAGLLWSRTRHASALLDQHLGKLQHPLTVALLAIAGAAAAPSMLVVWLAVPLVIFRLTGKLLGAGMVARLTGAGPPSEIGVALVAPGIVGVAFALQVAQVHEPSGAVIASAAALATVANEAIGLAVRPAERP